LRAEGGCRDRDAELRAGQHGEWQWLTEQSGKCVNGGSCHRQAQRENHQPGVVSQGSQVDGRAKPDKEDRAEEALCHCEELPGKPPGSADSGQR
jgi:hypothetical protein